MAAWQEDADPRPVTPAVDGRADASFGAPAAVPSPSEQASEFASTHDTSLDDVDEYDVTALADEAYGSPPKGFLGFASGVLLVTVLLGALAVYIVSSVQGAEVEATASPTTEAPSDLIPNEPTTDEPIAEEASDVGPTGTVTEVTTDVTTDLTAEVTTGDRSGDTAGPAPEDEGTPAGQWAGTARIQMVGDSITEAPQTRAFLVDALTERGCAFDMVGTRNRFADEVTDADHDGYEGFTTTQLAGVVPEAITAAAPGIVLLHAGTNDLGARETPQATAGRLVSLVESIQSARPGATVFVAQIIPLRDRIAEVEAYNELIAEQVSALSSRRSPVIVVDAFDGFDLDAHTDDGIHPNDAGGAVLGAAWLAAIERTFGTC